MTETAATHEMTQSGRCYALEDLNRGNLNREQNQRKSITNIEVSKFWRKIQVKEYSVEEHIKKTPAHISIIDLLMSSENNKDARVKVLSGVRMLQNTTSEALTTIIGRCGG